jgi:hypothetical protein
VGANVGALLGEAEGEGVGLLFSYVGASVGEAEVGALLGKEEEMGVGAPKVYDGTSVDGTSVGKAVGALIFILCVEELLGWAVGWPVG